MRMPMALGPTTKGLPPAMLRTLAHKAGRLSRFSITVASSAAWTMALVVKVSRSISSRGGRLRLSSVKN